MDDPKSWKGKVQKPKAGGLNNERIVSTLAFTFKNMGGPERILWWYLIITNMAAQYISHSQSPGVSSQLILDDAGRPEAAESSWRRWWLRWCSFIYQAPTHPSNHTPSVASSCCHYILYIFSLHYALCLSSPSGHELLGAGDQVRLSNRLMSVP